MNIINLFKNNLSRTINQKATIIVAVIVVPLFILVAVLFSAKVQMRSHIALVTEHAQNIPQNDMVKFDIMKKKPAISKLLLGKYAAIVEEKSDGTYKVTTIKNKADKKTIEDFFKNGKIEGNQNKSAQRGTGTNILGFILMIILMQGVALTNIFPQDRILKTFRRVLTAPVSEGQYLFVLGIFTFLCIYIPTYLAIAITKVCFGVEIGFNLFMLAILIGILSALSTALALFFSSVLENEISLAATAVYVITCVLGGCFYSFTENNKVLDAICSVLPQKAYLTLSQGIENGKGMLELKGQLIYLLIWIVALWFLGSTITKRKMKEGIY